MLSSKSIGAPPPEPEMAEDNAGLFFLWPLCFSDCDFTLSLFAGCVFSAAPCWRAPNICIVQPLVLMITSVDSSHKCELALADYLR